MFGTEKQIKIKYPKAKSIESLPLMKRGGTYSKQFPEGAIVHFTAGWQSQKPKDAISAAVKAGHRYFFIDETGQVWQQFDLSGYGAHAGESICPATKRTTVSKYYVGIEVACAGSLSDVDKDGQIDDTWFKQLNLPSKTVNAGHYIGKFQNVKGVFQKFNELQEASLIELLIWLCEMGMNPDLIWGHDEVAPKRKNDPGLSLSLKMDDFRILIKGKLS